MAESLFSKRLRRYLDETRQDYQLLARKLDVPPPVIHRLLISGDDPPQYIIERLNKMTGKRWNTEPSVPDPFESRPTAASLSDDFMKKPVSKADQRADNPFGFLSTPRPKKDDEPKSVHDLFGDPAPRSEEPAEPVEPASDPSEPKEDAVFSDESDKVVNSPEGLANLREHMRLALDRFGSKTAFARAVGVSSMSISNWMTKTVPTIENVDRLAKALEMDRSALYLPPAAPEAAEDAVPEAGMLQEEAESGVPTSTAVFEPEPGPVPIEPEDEPAAPEEDPLPAEEPRPAPAPAYRDEDDDEEDDLPEERESERKPQKKQRAEDQIPEADRILTCLGERIRAYMVDNDMTPYDMSECMPRRQGDAFRLVWLTVGTAFPKPREAKALAETLGISVEELRIEARLPSRNVRSLPDYREVAERWGFGSASAATPNDAPQAVVPEDAAADPEVPAAASGTVLLRTPEELGHSPDPDADRPKLTAVSAAEGLIAERAARGTAFLYTVPDAELSPVFEAGTAVLVDTQGFAQGRSVKAGDLPGSGWYLIRLGGRAVLRHLVPSADSFTVSTTSEHPFIRLSSLQIIGRAAAKIPVIRL